MYDPADRYLLCVPISSQRRIQTLVPRRQTSPAEEKCDDEFAIHRGRRFRSHADGPDHQLFGQVDICFSRVCSCFGALYGVDWHRMCFYAHEQ